MNVHNGRIIGGMIVLLIWTLSLTYSHEIFSKQATSNNQRQNKIPRNLRHNSKHRNKVRIREIKAKQLKRLLTRKSNIAVINVLAKSKYDDCRIAGSINIPLEELEDKAPTLSRRNDIIVYGTSRESAICTEAFAMLKKLGFKKLHAYQGGIKEWRSLGYPIEGTCIQIPEGALIGGATQ